jgi:hypothetical protein
MVQLDCVLGQLLFSSDLTADGTSEDTFLAGRRVL